MPTPAEERTPTDRDWHTDELPATPQRDFLIPATRWVEAPDALVSLGADLDQVIDDETPFLHCWKNSRFKSAGFLLTAGSNVNFQDSKGKTALHYALEKSFEPKLVRLLVKHGAAPELKDREGVSSATKAARKRDTAYLAALKL